MTFPLAICVKVEEYSMDIFISTCHISLNQKQVRLIETCQHSRTTSDTLFFFQNNTLQYYRNVHFVFSGFFDSVDLFGMFSSDPQGLKANGC